MPGNIGRRIEVLEYVANKTRAPWQAGHRGDMALGGNPALGNAADYSANRRGGLVAWAGVVRSGVRLGSIGSSRISMAWLYRLSRHVWTLVGSPTKPDRKVDAAVAPMMAMGRAMVESEQAKGLDGLLANRIFR